MRAASSSHLHRDHHARDTRSTLCGSVVLMKILLCWSANVWWSPGQPTGDVTSPGEAVLLPEHTCADTLWGGRGHTVRRWTRLRGGPAEVLGVSPETCWPGTHQRSRSPQASRPPPPGLPLSPHASPTVGSGTTVPGGEWRGASGRGVWVHTREGRPPQSAAGSP